MGALFKKLLRNISQGKGQFMAVVAVVTIGIMVYVGMSSTYYNLKNAQETFYKEANFADYYFSVVKAPERLVKEVEALPGIKRVTGRITLDVPILKSDGSRATARIVTYSLPMDKELNKLLLNSGRLFSSSTGDGIEVNTNIGFALANNIEWGDSVTIIYEGKPIVLNIVGTADSPEFIYPIRDIAELLPDHEAFGIFMLPQDEAGQAFDYNGQFNQLLVEFTPNADTTQIVAEIKDMLQPYGLLTSYPRADQLSHALLEMELDSIQNLVTVLPFIFLSMAAAIQFVILRRMVRNQRGQIGIIKALGYSNQQIIFHYSTYGLLVGLIGAAGGIFLGIIFGRVLTDYFLVFFSIPMQAGGYNREAVIFGFILSIVVGLAAGWSASRSVAKIKPADSMRPTPPKMGSNSIVEKLPLLWSKLSPDWKISLRSISRNRGRFMLTTVGVAFAVALLVVSYFMNDAVDYMMKSFLYDQKYDLIIRTSTPVKASDLDSIAGMEEVLLVEPFLELPVRMTYKGKSEEEVISAYPDTMSLKILENENGNILVIPDSGLLLNDRIAKKIGVSVGEDLEIETLLPWGGTQRDLLRVVGISQQMMGSATFMDLKVANNLLDENNLISGAMLKVETGQVGLVEAQLNKMLNLSNISSKEKEIANFETNLEAMIYTVSLMVFLAMVLGFAIVYNASLMTFIERERELASLKLIGYSNNELAGLLGKENLLQSILGIVIGLPLGKLMAASFINSVDTDLYSFPIIIYPSTYMFATISALAFIIIAYFIGVKGVRRIILVETLKNRD